MPTIIQVNDKNFKFDEQPLVAFFEEPLESVYYVKNPETTSSHKLLPIEKKIVEFAINMKVLPECKHCKRTMNVTKVEPYINEHYRITFQCQNNQCRKDIQSIYFENMVYQVSS